MIVYVVLSLGGALTGSLSAVFLVPLVQPGHALSFGRFAFERHGNVDVQAVWFLAVTVVFALLRWQSARLGAYLVGAYGMSLRRKVHARLISARLAALANSTSAEIANVLTHNVELLTQGFGALLQLFVAAVTSIVSLGLAFCVSPSLMLAAPLLAALGVIASRAYSREQVQVSRQYVMDMTRLFWLSEDFPRRLRHVRSFGREDAEKAGYGAISDRLGHGYRRQLELVASGRLMLELLGAVGIAALFVLAGRWRGIDHASLIAVCLLLGRLLPYLVATRQSFQQLRSATPALELWQRYMQLDVERASPAPVRGIGNGHALHIERINWRPPSAGLEIEHLVLVPGELTLICGDSGIGKSSLVDVLAGMTAPDYFVARIGAERIDFEQYQALVGHGAYVSQHVRPWQQTVRECLCWAAPDATDEMMWSALDDVGLRKRLAHSACGLDTALSSASSRFSGGELQRLLLSQVILRRPSIALLDEATNALDVASELSVLAAIKQRLPNTVQIVVSHRQDVMSLADTCVSIASDRVEVSGKHRRTLHVKC